MPWVLSTLVAVLLGGVVTAGAATYYVDVGAGVNTGGCGQASGASACSTGVASGCFDVQIEGCGVREIVSMTSSSITFASSCSWSAGAKVHVPWVGSAPDMGAYEYGTTSPVTMQGIRIQGVTFRCAE